MNKQRLADRIRDLRMNHAWSQEQLADVAGVNPRTIQRIESAGGCGTDTLGKLAQAFKIEVAEFVTLTNEEPQSSAETEIGSDPYVPILLHRIRNGKVLIDRLRKNGMVNLDHFPVETEEEASTVGSFLQEINDYVLISDVMEVSDEVALDLRLTQYIMKLEELHLLVFAESVKRKIRWGDTDSEPLELGELVLLVVRANNPMIVNNEIFPVRVPKVGKLF